MELLVLMELELVIELHTHAMMDTNRLVMVMQHVNKVDGQNHLLVKVSNMYYYNTEYDV